METTRYFIGLDLGTSAVKGVLLDATGAIVAESREPTAYQCPQPGWVEFDAEAFYQTIATLTARLAGAVPPGGTLAGLAMASASGNTVLADAAGVPLRPAISWMDTRGEPEIATVYGPIDAPAAHDLAGWGWEPALPMAHLAWIKVHEPATLQRAAHVAMSTEYVVFRLTGQWVTDASTATPSLLLDQKHNRWHQPYLDALGILADRLPRIHSIGAVVGAISPAAAAQTGLPEGLPVVSGGFDHPSAARASGISRQGQMLLSCGTSWVSFFPIEDRAVALRLGLLIDPFLQPRGAWGAMASLAAVSDRIDALIRTHIDDGPDRFATLDRLAGQSEPGAHGLRLDPLSTAVPEELSQWPKADIARALMEGVARLVQPWLADLAAQGIPITGIVMAGGPSQSPMWRQVLSQVLGLPVGYGHGAASGAVGAAMLAAAAIAPV